MATLYDKINNTVGNTMQSLYGSTPVKEPAPATQPLVNQSPVTLFQPNGQLIPGLTYGNTTPTPTKTNVPAPTKTNVPTNTGTGKTGQFGNQGQYTYNVDANGNAYGPLLATATSTAPVPSAPPTPGSMSAGLYSAPVNPDQARIDEAQGILTNTQYETDPNVLFKNNLAQYQATIDAVNTMYADRINRARIEGQGRLESRQFAQGRAGLIGSGTGEAGLNTVRDANEDVIRGIENEKALAVQEILGKVRAGAAEQARANTEAKRAGASKLLDYLKVEKPAMKKKMTSDAVRALLAKGIDISQMTPEEINSYITGLGISKDEFTNAFSSAQSEIEAGQLEAEKERASIDKTKAEIEKLKGEEKQKALDRALEQKKIDVQWYNAETSRTNATGKGSQKNYDSKTIPTDIKQELFSDIVSNSNAKRKERKSLNDFIASYPEIDTDYLTELYEANN